MSRVQVKSWYAEVFVGLILLLVLVAGVTRWRLNPGVPAEAGQPELAFSASSTAKLLSHLLAEDRPHPVDSTANELVKTRIIEALESYGYRAEIQDTTSCNERNNTCARVRNVIAVLGGTAPGRSILASAHYDSVPASPGVSDNGVGVAMLLETARLFKAQPAKRNTVVFLFTDGEEAGLLGAKAFAAEHRLADKVGAVINVEARGTSGRSVLFETGDRNAWLIREFAKTSRQPVTNSLIPSVYALMPNDTDYSVFKARGIQGLNFAFGEKQSYYHTSLDNVQQLDLGSLQQQGNNVHDLLNALADAELPSDIATGHLVYTDLFGIGIVRWPSAWSAGIAVALIVLFGFAARRIYRQTACTGKSVAWGVFGGLLSPVLGAVVAYALTYILSLVRKTASPWPAEILSNRLLLWVTVLLATIAVYRLLARRHHPVGLWLGVGAGWLLLALTAAVLLPGASYLFILPGCVMVICALIMSLRSNTAGSTSPIILSIPAVASFIVIIPAIFLVEIMMGYGTIVGVVFMAALLGMSVSTILPFAQSAQAPKLNTAVTATLSLAIVLAAAMTLRAPAFTAEEPQPLNMMYVQAQDGKAMLTAGNVYNRPPQAVLNALGKEAALRPPFSWNDTRFYSIPVASQSMPSASLAVLEETPLAQGRRIRARINAEAGVSMVQILFPKAAGVKSIEMGGRKLDYSEVSDDYVAFFCRGESCNGREVAVTLGQSRQSSIVIGISPGLPAAFNSVSNSRAPYAVPMGHGDQSIVVSESLM